MPTDGIVLPSNLIHLPGISWVASSSVFKTLPTKFLEVFAYGGAFVVSRWKNSEDTPL